MSCARTGALPCPRVGLVTVAAGSRCALLLCAGGDRARRSASTRRSATSSTRAATIAACRSACSRRRGRHELSALGGVYAADLMSSSYLVAAARTRSTSPRTSGSRRASATRARDSELCASSRGHELRHRSAARGLPVYLYQGHLLWTLAYGKLRWFGARISRFDFNLALGGGVTDNRSARRPDRAARASAQVLPATGSRCAWTCATSCSAQELLGESRLCQQPGRDARPVGLPAVRGVRCGRRSSQSGIALLVAA